MCSFGTSCSQQVRGSVSCHNSACDIENSVNLCFLFARSPSLTIMSPRITEGGPFAAILKAIGPDSGVQPCVGSMKDCARDPNGETCVFLRIRAPQLGRKRTGLLA